jgi:hypothetical protein
MMTKSVLIILFAIINLSVVNAVVTKQQQKHQWGVDTLLSRNKKESSSERERKRKAAISKTLLKIHEENVKETKKKARGSKVNKETILFQKKKLEPTCALDFDTKTYDGVCTTNDECRLTVIDKDGHARSAGASYSRHQAGPRGSGKCGNGLSCCADVKCLAGNGHCIDSAKQKCTYKTISGQCPGGKTVSCCPYAANSVDKWNEKRFENNVKCLGGRGTCRLRKLAPCKHAWVRRECGSGNDVCCPSSATAKEEWEKEKLKKKCDFVGPAAKYLNLDITTLMAFIKVESGGSASAIRFECHKFRQYDKVNGKSIPCTINKGDSFSRVHGESGAKAFKKAYNLNKVAAIKSTSYGLFQVMGGYLLSGIMSDPAKALELFEKNPEDVSLQLLILWFSDPSWGAKAAVSARQINSADGATDQKHWKQLVSRYNGNGQVPYYVGKLQEAYKFYEGKCPSADKYDSKDAFKSSGIVSPGEIKLSSSASTFDAFRSAFPSFNLDFFMSSMDFLASRNHMEDVA